MKAQEIRKIARDNLKGKWGKGVLFTLAFLIVIWGLALFLSIFAQTPLVVLAYVLYILVMPPLGFAMSAQFLKLSRGDDVSSFNFINWSNFNFSKSWKVVFHIIKKLILPIIILIICVLFATFSMISGILGIFEDANASITLLSMGFATIGWIRIHCLLNLANGKRIPIFISCISNGR